MIRPYNEYQPVSDTHLRPRERLEPARAALRHAVSLLEQFSRRTESAWDHLSDEELQTICDAAEAALNAAQNAAFLGESGYCPRPIREIRWPGKE